jgi:hypothetical protein
MGPGIAVNSGIVEPLKTPAENHEDDGIHFGARNVGGKHAGDFLEMERLSTDQLSTCDNRRR